jgi:hypothetical protein
MSDSKAPPFPKHRGTYIALKIAVVAAAAVLGLRLAGVL